MISSTHVVISKTRLNEENVTKRDKDTKKTKKEVAKTLWLL